MLTLVLLSRICLPSRWRRYVPPKRRFTQELHGATSQKTAFFKFYRILILILGILLRLDLVSGNLHSCLPTKCCTHALYIPLPSNPPSLDRSDNIQRRIYLTSIRLRLNSAHGPKYVFAIFWPIKLVRNSTFSGAMRVELLYCPQISCNGKSANKSAPLHTVLLLRPASATNFFLVVTYWLTNCGVWTYELSLPPVKTALLLLLPGGSGTTISHNTQIIHITQNNTPCSKNTIHKTTQTIKDTLHTMNTM
jgi:hypothetical protein